MNTLKYIGQILASIVYTPLFTGIMYLAISLPIAWIASLSIGWMILAIAVYIGINEILLITLHSLGMIPYGWILDDNKISFVISLILCILLPLNNIVQLWTTPICEERTTRIILSVIMTGGLLHFIIGTLICLFKIKDK